MNNDWREYYDPDYILMHHGIKGQKWGIRRFQTESGALTALGRKRYDDHVTVHAPGKRVPFVSGGNKFQTHREYITANKFAKESYKKRKEKIREEKKNSDEGFVKKNVNAAVKNYDNRKQLQYELDRNRLNAGDAEFKRNVAKNTATAAAKSAAVVGAGVLGGMLAANYQNNRMRKEGAGQLPMHGLDSHYEYKIGYDKVAKYMGKAIAFGAISGVTASAAETYRAQQAVKRADKINGNRARRYNADLKKWQEGEV